MPGVKSGSLIEVQIAEGAEIGLDKIREAVMQEIQKDGLEEAKQ